MSEIGSSGRISLDLLCLTAMREARSQFVNDIIDHARTHGKDGKFDSQDSDILHSVETIAEFYYGVKQYNLADQERIRSFLLRHNEDIAALLKNESRRRELNLSPERLKDGLFSEEQIENVVQEVSEGKLRLNQADLGRLLAPLMAPEKTRKGIIALADAGLLNRFKVGRVLIVSPGHLERYFEKHLQLIVSSMKAAFGTVSDGAQHVSHSDSSAADLQRRTRRKRA